MDFYDVSVRVLYDFEYTTKYGRNIKITSGERLLLIKKTNSDWWQVIRSSEQRPFFVPASYVVEIEGNQNGAKQNQNKTKYHSQTSSEKNVTSPGTFSKEHFKTSPETAASNNEFNMDNTSSSKLCSSVKQTTVSNLKYEVTNPPQTMILSSTLSSSGYNSLGEEVPVFEEDSNTVDDSNTNSTFENRKHFESKANSDIQPDNNQSDVTVNSPVLDKQLSVIQDKGLRTSNCEVSRNTVVSCDSKYSALTNNARGCVSKVSGVKVMSGLPPSDSLENLSLEIELKTSSLRNASERTKKCSSMPTNESKLNCSSENIVTQNEIASYNNIKKETDKYSKVNYKDNLLHSWQNKNKESRSSENVCSNLHLTVDNNLHYHGSFKTNNERQRWFKKSSSERQLRNVFSCSEDSAHLRNTSECLEEDSNYSGNVIQKITSNETDQVKCITKRCVEMETKKTEEALQRSECEENVLHTRHFSFGSDSQLSHLKTVREKTTSHHSLDSVVEGELRETCSDEFEQRKFKTKEFVPVAKGLDSLHTNSEKSSLDSLLEIENDSSCRKISGGTTSDSFVPTDGDDLASSESETDSIKQTSKLDDSKSAGSNPRKVSLTRRRRILSTKSRLNLSQDPPSPINSQVPTRTLSEGWNEYSTQDGRKYFYNLHTKEKRWKPPRRFQHANVDVYEEHDSIETADSDDMFVVSVPLPNGWRSEIDSASGQTCYINIFSGAKWFSSTDNEGRVYFFEENSNKSSWALPESENLTESESKVPKVDNNSASNVSPAEKSLNRNAKSKSLILGNRFEDPTSLSNSSQNWPQLWRGAMCVLKEGPLNKTKITENGKKVRKHWTSTHAVLTELLLLFFKDNKGFSSMMSGNGRPELSVDLNGAVIDLGDKISSRKNVYMLSTVLGLQVLIQCDCPAVAEQWLHAIQGTINNLPSSIDTKVPSIKSGSPEENKITTRIGRSKSMKLKNKSASIEDMSVNIADRQTKIKERLKKFFNRRPTVELLVKKGIWKDEPVFGCLLEHACPTEPPRVPMFVQHCIHCIENSEENMKTDGLYRASGNLSQVQKIRLQVDQNIYSLLEQEEDVHVLAGALKLFFRELKQPLIPFKFFNKALNACTNSNRTEKIKEFREIVKSLPPCNHDTLKFLLQHLLSVSKYQEFNRMHIPNIAIVFGPTLMWPEQESLNMAFDLMQQNLVIECFLSDFHAIFL